MVARRCEAHPYFSAQWCKRGAGHLDGTHVTSITGLHYAWTSPSDGWYLDDGAEVCAEVAYGPRGIVACWLPVGHERDHAGRSADHTFHTWPAIDPSEREPLTVDTTEWDSIDDEAVEKVAESMQVPESMLPKPYTFKPKDLWSDIGPITAALTRDAKRVADKRLSDRDDAIDRLRRAFKPIRDAVDAAKAAAEIRENHMDDIPTVEAQPAKIEYLDSEQEPFVRVVAYVETHHGEISRVERTAFLDETDDPDGIETSKDLQAHVSRILYRGI